MDPLGRRWAETFGGTCACTWLMCLICPSRQSVAPAVRAWHAKVLRPRVGRTSISQSYRLVRSVFNEKITPRYRAAVVSRHGLERLLLRATKGRKGFRPSVLPANELLSVSSILTVPKE